MDRRTSSLGSQIRDPFTSNALHTEHNCIDLSQATLHLFFPLWWMGSGTRDPLIIDDEWPVSISKRVRFLQRAARRDTFRRTRTCIWRYFFPINQKQWSGASFFCPLLCCSLISSGSCWDQEGIPWRDYKRRQEWRCRSLGKGQWGIKTR